MVRRQAAARTLGQQAKVWLVRALLNLLVLALLAAAFYGVFWATGATVELQVSRVWGKERPRVLEPTLPRMEGRGREPRSKIPGILGAQGRRRCLDPGLKGPEGRRGRGRPLRMALFLVCSPSQEMPLVQQTPLLKLLVNYLPSIFISAVNFVLPPVFKFIAPLEGYTRSRQIVIILLRFQPPGVGWGWWNGSESGYWLCK